MPAPDRLDPVHAVITDLFDAPIGVGVTDPRATQPDSMGAEAAHLVNASAGRKTEFNAGRTAARRAMQAFGFPPCAVPSHKDRSPIWPDGLTGSISHKRSLCAAVVTRAPVCLGLDIEEDSDLGADLIPTICSTAEIARIAGPDQARLAKLIFSAKEAAYKAQYPLTRTLFGFDHMEIDLDHRHQSFTARFVKPVAKFEVGDCLPGRFSVVAGHIVTGVTLGQIARKGA